MSATLGRIAFGYVWASAIKPPDAFVEDFEAIDDL